MTKSELKKMAIDKKTERIIKKFYKEGRPIDQIAEVVQLGPSVVALAIDPKMMEIFA
jgi:DNA-binding Lrp family transcriptional regulator